MDAQHSIHERKLAEKRARRKRERQDAERKYLTAPQVQNRYGVTDKTVDRWLKSPTLRFPQPTFRINNYRYWSESILDEWDAQRMKGRATA